MAKNLCVYKVHSKFQFSALLLWNKAEIMQVSYC